MILIKEVDHLDVRQIEPQNPDLQKSNPNAEFCFSPWLIARSRVKNWMPFSDTDQKLPKCNTDVVNISTIDMPFFRAYLKVFSLQKIAHFLRKVVLYK